MVKEKTVKNDDDGRWNGETGERRRKNFDRKEQKKPQHAKELPSRSEYFRVGVFVRISKAVLQDAEKFPFAGNF
jgi:hypothetical protein